MAQILFLLHFLLSSVSWLCRTRSYQCLILILYLHVMMASKSIPWELRIFLKAIPKYTYKYQQTTYIHATEPVENVCHLNFPFRRSKECWPALQWHPTQVEGSVMWCDVMGLKEAQSSLNWLQLYCLRFTNLAKTYHHANRLPGLLQCLRKDRGRRGVWSFSFISFKADPPMDTISSFSENKFIMNKLPFFS